MNPASRRTVLLATDRGNSIIGEIVDGKTKSIAYSAYGEQSAQQEIETRLGFNGQLREANIGWYLLGNGYRAYNTRLMRFHSPDSWSPFGGGGLNAYMYCVGDPVNRSDPTGHSWIRAIAGVADRLGIVKPNKVPANQGPYYWSIKANKFLGSGSPGRGPRDPNKLTALDALVDSAAQMQHQMNRPGWKAKNPHSFATTTQGEGHSSASWGRSPIQPLAYGPIYSRRSNLNRSAQRVGFHPDAKSHDGPSSRPRREHNQLQGGEVHPRRNHWPSKESIASTGSNQSTGSTFYSANSTNASNTTYGSAASINSDRYERAAELRGLDEMVQRLNALEREAGVIRRGSNAGL